MTRILIVEDEPTIAAALQDDLEIDGYAVEVAKDGANGLELALKQDYNLILLDIMLPRKDGLAVCRELRAAGKRTPVIMLTAKGQEIDKVLGLELGADDYVTKPFSPRELKARIKATLRRATPEPPGNEGPQVFEFGDVTVDFKRCELRRAGQKVELTAMEFKLLRTFLKHRGEVLSIDRLLDEIWGKDAFLTDRVIYTHVNNLRQEEVEGNLEAAIGTYKKVIAATGAPRALAATAQYRIGLCYEKLGNTEARKAFQRVLTTYQDQKDTVALARARLTALEAAGPKAAAANGLSLRQIKIESQFMGRPSPDGRYLAYADKENDVAVYDLNTGTSRKITHRDIKLEGFPGNFSWSPDGTRIAYVWNTRKNKEYFFELRVVGFDGSAPRSLYDSNDKSIECLSWFPDGMSIIVANDSPSQLVRVPVDKGSVQIIKTIEGEGAWDMAVSPDGKFIACSVYPAEIFLIPSLGGSETTIVREKGLVRLFGWDVEGKSVLFTSDRSGTIGLWRVMIANGKLLAEPELVKADVGNVWPEGSTRSGSYYYTVGGRQQDIYISTLDMAGGKVVAPPKRVNSTNIGSCASPAWSPDGKHLAYLAAATPSQTVSYSKVCIWSAVDGTQREYVLNISLGATGYPISWSADGRFLQGRAYNGAKTDVVRINAQTGEVFAVASNQKGDIPDWGRGVMFEWSPDTKTVFKNLTGPNSSGPIGVLAYDLANGRETELFRSPEGTTVTSALGKPLSPDGKWLAMRIDGQEQTPPRSYKLIAIPTEGGAVRELAALTHWQGPYYLSWSPDTKHVLYPLTDRSRGVAELWEVPLDGGAPRNLGLEVPGSIGQISLNPDGKRIAFRADATHPRELWVIENISALKAPGK